MTPSQRRAAFSCLPAVLVAASLLPVGSAFGHGGETAPGHHDDDAAGKQSGGVAKTKGTASEGSVGVAGQKGAREQGTDSQTAPSTAAGASEESGGGGSPVPHFIGLFALAAIGTGVILFQRNRQRHAAESG